MHIFIHSFRVRICEGAIRLYTFSTLLNKVALFSKAIVPIHTPISSVREFPQLTLDYYWTFKLCQFEERLIFLIVFLISISLITDEIKHAFVRFLSLLAIFLLWKNKENHKWIQTECIGMGI